MSRLTQKPTKWDFTKISFFFAFGLNISRKIWRRKPFEKYLSMVKFLVFEVCCLTTIQIQIGNLKRRFLKSGTTIIWPAHMIVKKCLHTCVCAIQDAALTGSDKPRPLTSSVYSSRGALLPPCLGQEGCTNAELVSMLHGMFQMNNSHHSQVVSLNPEGTIFFPGLIFAATIKWQTYQMLSLFSNKDRRADSWIWRKNIHSVGPAEIRTRIFLLLVGRSCHWPTQPGQELRANSCLSPCYQFFFHCDWPKLPESSSTQWPPYWKKFCWVRTSFNPVAVALLCVGVLVTLQNSARTGR